MTHHLYRHFDSDGVLLYVGQSKCAINRLNGHKRESSWYDSIATVTIEPFASRAQALRAEQEAISREKPRFNIHGGEPEALWPEWKLPKRFRRGVGNGRLYAGIAREPERFEITKVETWKWYAMMTKGTAPRQIRLGQRSVGWLRSELHDWVDAQKAKRVQIS
jgi:predicted DNA-binding transcriptional regulator AlpA